jgi:sugar phosphate permease
MFYYKKRQSTARNEKFDVKPIKYRMIIVIVYLIGIFIFMHLFNFYIKKNSSDIKLIYSVSIGSGFLIYGCISLLGVMAMEFTSREFSGSSHAIASFSANVGSIFAGLPFSIISKLYSWNVAFKIVQACLVLVILCTLLFRNCNSYFVPAKKKMQ